MIPKSQKRPARAKDRIGYAKALAERIDRERAARIVTAIAHNACVVSSILRAAL